MEEGLHGSHTLCSGLPTKVRIKTHHGAQKRHGAVHKGNETVSCTALNVVRDRRVGRPEKRGLRQREGEAKRWRQSTQALEEDSNLLKRPDSGDIINVGRDSETK